MENERDYCCIVKLYGVEVRIKTRGHLFRLNENIWRNYSSTLGGSHLTQRVCLGERAGRKPSLFQVESASQLPLKVIEGHRQKEWW